MSITFSITGLDQNELSQAEEFLRETMSDVFPSLDLKEGGVWHNILIRVPATLYTANQSVVDQLQQSNSLLALNANPTLADSDMLAAVMSNYLITPGTGTYAAGYALINISSNVTTAIPAGTTFTSGSLTFATQSTCLGVTSELSAMQTNATLIVERSDGTYEFTVPIVASQVGLTSNIEAGTALTMSISPSNLIAVTAAADFSGGADATTVEQVLGQLQSGVTSQVMSGRANIFSLLQSQLATLSNVSIVGMGDAEMLRSKHNICGIDMGGKSDIYVQTSGMPIQLSLLLQATLIPTVINESSSSSSSEESSSSGSEEGGSQTWQITIDRNTAPGFYTIESILPTTAGNVSGSLAILSDIRAVDLAAIPGKQIPDIANAVEGAYTRYQTATIQFIDPSTPLTTPVGTTANYVVNLYCMPSIDTLQDYISSRDTDNPCADYLIKAPVPIFVAVDITIQYPSSKPIPSVADLLPIIASVVNSQGFTGVLQASDIVAAVGNYLGSAGTIALPITISGQTFFPDGTTTIQRSTRVLTVPINIEQAVSARTALFFWPQSSIAIHLIPVTAVSI